MNQTSIAQPDVAVIGGGIGGLSAALRLAIAGAKVTLFEKNATLGGKLNIWSDSGFEFDTGPHVLTMLFALEELFAAAEEDLYRAVDIVKLPTVCRYHFPDGMIFEPPSDIDSAGAVMDSCFPGSLVAFQSYLEYAAKIYETTTTTFLTHDVASLIKEVGVWKMLQLGRDFLKLRPFESLDTCVSRHFADDRLRQIFRLYALYSGSHPKRCSAIFSTVAHIQWQTGTFYVVGGLYRLVEALRGLLDRFNVSIVCSAEVVGIDVQDGKCCAIQYVEGSVKKSLTTDGVICNQDLLTASNNLLPTKRCHSVEPSTSAFVILAGIEGSFSKLAHHNSFLTGDEWREYSELFDSKIAPTDPTIGVSCQSVTDPTRSPVGASNLFIMANVPSCSTSGTWTSDRTAEYRRLVLNKLENCGLENLSRRIVTEQIWTPDDFSQRYNASKGAIYGLSSNGWRQAFLRPSQKAKGYRGIYFAGGSTHPGGGIPLCVLSGTTAARLLLDDLSRY